MVGEWIVCATGITILLVFLDVVPNRWVLMYGCMNHVDGWNANFMDVISMLGTTNRFMDIIYMGCNMADIPSNHVIFGCI